GFVVTNLPDKRALGAEHGGDGGAVRAAATDGFLQTIDGSFAIAKEVITGDQRRRLEIAIDVSDDAQPRALEDRFIEHGANVLRLRGIGTSPGAGWFVATVAPGQWVVPRSSSGNGCPRVSGANGSTNRPSKKTAHMVTPA